MKEFITSQIVNTEKELIALKDFLKINQLPYNDIHLNDCFFLTYFNSLDELVGCGGLEFYGENVLLRSLAVNQGLRGQLLGKQIVQDLIEQVKQKGLKEIYLLTQSALFFFLKFGFIEINREEVPAEILVSTEFSTECPSSAHVMKLVL
jgi:amino-acid N-acetyltransferase